MIGLNIGTCSWKYDSWEGLVYSSRKPVNYLQGITNALAQKDKVTLIGFGTFSSSDRKERTGKNPQTGEAMTIPAKTVVKFKAGKALGDEVNNG